MRLIFIRHPQTQANVSRLIYGRTESDYSAAGHQMIPWIVNQLADIRIDAIYASPLQRTKVLAEQIAAAYGGQSVQLDERLIEMHFGIFENMPGKLARSQYEKEYNSYLADFNDYLIPEGESFRLVQRRGLAFVQELADQYGGHAEDGPRKSWEEVTADDEKQQAQREKTVVIVSHSMVIHAVLADLLKIDLADIWHLKIEPGTIVDVLYQWDFAMLQGLYPPPGK